MRAFTFSNLLEEADSVLDLARRLGAACMEQEAELRVTLEDDFFIEIADRLRDHVLATDLADWEAVVAAPGELEARLGTPFADLLGQVDVHYPVDCLGVLRGLCRRILPLVYREMKGELLLRRGAPVPFALRPLLGDEEKTPLPKPLNKTGLLSGYGHRLFEFFPEKESLRVVLDFRARDRLDALTWSKRERLPRIATVHPAGSRKLEVGTMTETRFFDASPAEWRPEEVVSLLERVKDVEIAVLPELSLPDPGALEEALATEPKRFPRLIVAGSAHWRTEEDGREVRANEARVYVDGERVGEHRKYNPFEARELDGRSLTEGLTNERKAIRVLSGEFTRLAIVICADLNDSSGPQKLIAAGINTLIVPSFTTKMGAFRGPIGDLSARCQAVCVIANAPPDEAAHPFYGIVTVPRPVSEEAVATYPTDFGPVPGQIVVFDPEEPLSTALSWR
jgi:hypothetical protein